MIEFKKSGQPVRCNRKCQKCVGDCKQHEDVKILKCPSFITKEKPIIYATAV